MQYSRLRRYEDSRQTRKMYGAIAGIIAIFIFLSFFGLKLLIGFSLLVDKIRGTPQQQVAQQLILPPELDPLLIATNSATIDVTGKAQAGMTVIIYINDTDTEKTTVDKNGEFRFENVKLTEGSNTLSAKQMDEAKNVSALSEVLTITSKKTKPQLEISDPSDNAQIRGENNIITISGKTNDDFNSVTINDRLAIVRGDGSFSYEYHLSEGDTTLAIIATDPAGNQTTVERKVNYQK